MHSSIVASFSKFQLIDFSISFAFPLCFYAVCGLLFELACRCPSPTRVKIMPVCTVLAIPLSRRVWPRYNTVETARLQRWKKYKQEKCSIMQISAPPNANNHIHPDSSSLLTALPSVYRCARHYLSFLPSFLLSLFSFVSNTVTVFCFGPLSSLSQTRRDSEARKTVPKTGYVRAYNVCCPATKRYTLLADVGD